MLQSPYQLDMTRVFHIWFSTNPNECLPALNKLRLIQKSFRNPRVSLSLVYSSECLNLEAQKDLEAFASKLHITLLDFDGVLLEANKDRLDQALYTFARREISHAKTHTGGNMASASDCVRLMRPLLEQYGHYVDFDVDIDFSQCSARHSVQFPVIVPSDTVNLPGMEMPVLCNHFLGAAIDPKDPTQLHPEALEKLNHVKRKIVSFYQGEDKTVLFKEFTGFPNSKGLHPELSKFIAQLYQACDFDIIKYRQTLAQINQIPADLKQSLLRDSVIQITGPMAWFSLYPETVERFQKLQNMVELGDILKDLSVLVKKSGYAYNGLEQCILSKDNAKTILEELKTHKSAEEVIGLKCDQSWTPMGALVLKDKSKALEDGVTSIQSAARGFLAKLSMSPD